MKAKVNQNKLLNKTTLVLFVLLFAAIGTYLIVNSRAAVNGTRYVNPSGNDTNNQCTLSSAPCKTFNRAYQLSNGGDTVIVQTGDYGTQTFTGRSDLTSAVMFVAEKDANGNAVNITNSFLMEDQNTPVSYITFDGRNADGSYGNHWDRVSGTIQYGAHHINFYGLHFRADNTGTTVWTTGRSHDIGFYDGELGPQIRGSDVLDFQPRNPGDPVPYNITVKGNDCHGVTRENASSHPDCIQFYTSCVPVANCVANTPEQTITGVLVEGNTFYNNEDDNMQCDNSVINPVVRNNVFYTAVISGFHAVRCMGENVTYAYNTFPDGGKIQQSSGFDNSGLTFIGNIGSEGQDGGCQSNSTYSHNIWFGQKCSGDNPQATNLAAIKINTSDGSLLSGSPAINAGDTNNYPNEDILGNPRRVNNQFIGSAPDAGAYEYGSTSTPPTNNSCKGRQFYIDYSTGSDSNNGTSKNSPWKRAPGMVGFIGSYTHTAKDCFYFKGGVTWPNNVFPLTTKGGGDSSGNDYFGTDTTWFVGASFSRPIWDGQNTPINGSVKSYFISTDNYITLDNLELTGYYARNCTYGGCPMVMWYGVTKQIADNMLVHNFNVRDEVSDGNAIIFQSATDQRSDNTLQNSEIAGDPESYITVTRAVNTVKNNNIHDAIGIIYPNGSGEVSGNLIYNCGYPKFPTGSSGHHADVIQMNPPNYSSTPEQTYLIHDNVIYNTGVDDANGNECETMLIGNPGENYYIWNNVIYNAHGNGIGLVQDSSAGGPAKSIYIWNNTLVGSRDFSGPCIRSGAGTQIIKIQNNHCITNSDFLYQVSANSFTQDHNLVQTPAQATSNGYTTNKANSYSPTSSNSPTVGGGINLTSICAGNLAGLCQDSNYANKRTVNTRPSTGAWNIGAYEYTGTSTPPTPTLPGDVDGNKVVDIDDLSLLLINWKKNYPQADFVKDNIIDIDDLSILLINWGK